MLAMSDINIEQFLPVFAELELEVAFLVPTPTGYGKSIMDATVSVRSLLKNSGLHDYEIQGQGQENKVVLEALFVKADGVKGTHASLYRPITKQGDPRIWFYDLKSFCVPCNLLALVTRRNAVYVINLSDEATRNSLLNKEFVYEFLYDIKHENDNIAKELLDKIQEVHDCGYLPSITYGDPGVGDTLEHALGISRNNLQIPDYKGIELKAKRGSRGNIKTPKTRFTIFTKVPDDGCTYHQILDLYGKVQIPRGESVPRKQIYETCSARRMNAYGLYLDVDYKKDDLEMRYGDAGKYVSTWHVSKLQEKLSVKHRETFWVKASSIFNDGVEYFRYDYIEHTKGPNISLLAPLLETGKITLDLAAHVQENGKYRDHGMLFKMEPEDLYLLFGKPVIYDLNH